MEIQVVGLANGILCGVQYFPKGEGQIDEEVEDWNELNIYLLLITLSIRWW